MSIYGRYAWYLSQLLQWNSVQQSNVAGKSPKFCSENDHHKQTSCFIDVWFSHRGLRLLIFAWNETRDELKIHRFPGLRDSRYWNAGRMANGSNGTGDWMICFLYPVDMRILAKIQAGYGGLEHVFFSPYVGKTCEYLILQLTNSYFFRGVAQPPTSKVGWINPYKSPIVGNPAGIFSEGLCFVWMEILHCLAVMSFVLLGPYLMLVFDQTTLKVSATWRPIPGKRCSSGSWSMWILCWIWTIS